MTTTNRIEDHHLKDGRGRTKGEPSNMQIMGSMLYTTFVRKIRALLLALMIAQVPLLIQSPTSVAVFMSVLFLLLYIAITMHRMICARHEFAHIARRMDKISRAAVAFVYALLVLAISGLITFSAIVPNIPDTSNGASSSGVPVWIMYVTLLLIAVANFIASIIDDLIIGGLTDLYDEDGNALAKDNVDSPAEDNADDSATTTHPSGSTRIATALSGFIVGYILGRSHR